MDEKKTIAVDLEPTEQDPDELEYLDDLRQLAEFKDRVPHLAESLKTLISQAIVSERVLEHDQSFERPWWCGELKSDETHGDGWLLASHLAEAFERTQYSTFYWRPSTGIYEGMYMLGWGHILNDDYVLARGFVAIWSGGDAFDPIFPKTQGLRPYIRDFVKVLVARGYHEMPGLVSLDEFQRKYLGWYAVVSRKTGRFVVPE